MTAICLVDTSVFCELLRVPGRCQDPESFLEVLERNHKLGEQILLPFAAILETGNHIGQAENGRRRRAAARRFVDQVRRALGGLSPFIPVAAPSLDELSAWLDRFPDEAGRGVGLADLSIRELWERQCTRYPSRRVYVWSKDRHLLAHDRPARL